MISPASVPAATRPDSRPCGPVPPSAETLGELERVRAELPGHSTTFTPPNSRSKPSRWSWRTISVCASAIKSEALARGQADLFNETAPD